MPNRSDAPTMTLGKLTVVVSCVFAAVGVWAATPVANKPADKAVVNAIAAAPTSPASPAQLRNILEREHGNVVILNLWGTWCAPCLREIPELVRLQQELAPLRVSLVGVAMDEASSIDSMVEPFRKKYFPAFRTYARNSPDMDSMVSVVDTAWNEILPTTYILDREGKVARKIQGVKTYDEFRTIVTKIANAG
ncbi:MAG TPA: redoxin domain-containing protein [Steroidobacteraceae bacterium]|nr:redoxin domain-containing protein [Steroidobacteraceae bacterium]